MKKIIAAAAALWVCGVMLAGCGENGSPEDVTVSTSGTPEQYSETETSAEAVTGAETETSAEAGTETEAGTGTETEADGVTGTDGAGYGSVDEFAGTEGIFDLPEDSVPMADSRTYAFLKTLEGAEEFYMDAEYADRSSAAAMAISGSNVYMKISEETDDGSVEMTVIIRDSVIYMLDDASRSGFYYTAGEEELEAIGPDSLDSILGAFGEMDLDSVGSRMMKTCPVDIGGEELVFETAGEGSGALFDGDRIRAIISTDENGALSAVIINDISPSVPSGIFDIPSDYQLADLSAAVSGTGE